MGLPLRGKIPLKGLPIKLTNLLQLWESFFFLFVVLEEGEKGSLKLGRGDSLAYLAAAGFPFLLARQSTESI